MKSLVLSSVVSLLLLGNLAFAGTASTAYNDALGFRLTQYPQGDIEADICNFEDKCYTLEFVKNIKNGILYREKTGLCELTMETFDHSFATGNTKNEFMLNLMAFVIKVTKGEDKCVLQQKDFNQKRALTGVYL